ncbi:hypothetical protein GCM10025793_00300 [Lysobacter lycopersici]
MAVSGIAGLFLLPGARAAVSERWNNVNAAQACQLSIPTIDTVVSPRATGFRNPGPNGAFVICGVSKDAGISTGVSIARLWLTSTDGAQHSVTCTGVAGASGIEPLVYITKTHSAVGASYSIIDWTSADFGGGGGGVDPMPGTGNTFSITCNLPPQVQIVLASAKYYVDVGN